MDFFYEETFTPGTEYPENLMDDDLRAIFARFAGYYNPDDAAPAWFEKLRGIAVDLDLAPDTKTFRKNMDSYRGHVGDVSMALRVAVTGRKNAPDLYAVMRILEKERVIQRIRDAG